MRFFHSHFVSFVFIVLFIFLNGEACLADNNAPKGRLTIEADRMESLQKKNIVIFTGHVEAKQGDLSIHADNMTIYYNPAGQGGADAGKATQNIEKLVAGGNVELSREGWTASGDNIDYLASEQKIILTGNTKVLQENNMITGERIVLDLEKGKSIVESSPEKGGRVKAIITPDGIEKNN